jgi:hypothetical protein
MPKNKTTDSESVIDQPVNPPQAVKKPEADLSLIRNVFGNTEVLE